MYKILVIDDDYPIREWLSFCINKHFSSSFSVECSSDGTQALECLSKQHYDMIITDIKMPGIDGMKLSEIVNKDYPDSYLIVLSSYSDYKYVRNAFKYNAHDYLLKTDITEEILINTINKYLEKHSFKIYKPSVVNDINKKLTSTGNLTADLLKEAGIDLPASDYFAIALKQPDTHDTRGSNNPFLPTLEGVQTIFMADFRPNVYYGCISVEPEDSEFEKIRLQRNWVQRVMTANNLSSLIISDIQNNYNSLSTVLQKVLQHIDIDYYETAITYLEELIIDENDVDSLFFELLSYIEVRNIPLIEEKIDLLFHIIENNKYPDIVHVKSMGKIICKNIFLKYKGQMSNLYEQENLVKKIDETTNFSELKNIINEELNIYLNKNLSNYSTYIKKAMSFIELHYTNQITLNEVADALYLNPEYFSRIFKKETGLTFITYLNNFRLFCAAKIINTTDLKMYEIVNKVGFNNLSYFCKKFKGLFGISPYKYRMKHLGY